MAYNLDNFVGLVSTSDRVLKIYDSNNIIKYTINAFSINTLKVINNIVVLSTRSKNIELDFSTSNEARLALSKLQSQLEILKEKTPLFIDKEISNFISTEVSGGTGPQGFTGPQGPIGLGETGVQGYTGPQGLNGIIGQTGSQGPTGPIENITINSVSVDYILSLSDSNKMVDVASSSTVTIGVPINSSVSFEIGTQILLVRSGSGAVGVTSYPGVTLSSAQGYLNLNYQYSAATLVKKGTDTWYIFGDLKI